MNDYTRLIVDEINAEISQGVMLVIRRHCDAFEKIDRLLLFEYCKARCLDIEFEWISGLCLRIKVCSLQS